MTDIQEVCHILRLFDHAYDEYLIGHHEDITEIELYISVTCNNIRFPSRNDTRHYWISRFHREIKSLLNFALIPRRRIPIRFCFLLYGHDPRRISLFNINGLIAWLNQHILLYYQNNAWHHLT